MAKRLTDTTKWNNPSFRKLPSKYKILYLYMLDNCDCAGVMHLDIELISFVLSEQFSLDEIRSFFQERIKFVAEDKVVIKNFIGFQNGDITDSKSSIAKSVRTTLNAHGLWARYVKEEFGHVNKAVALWESNQDHG